jgi:hypothetical protein
MFGLGFLAGLLQAVLQKLPDLLNVWEDVRGFGMEWEGGGGEVECGGERWEGGNQRHAGQDQHAGLPAYTEQPHISGILQPCEDVNTLHNWSAIVQSARLFRKITTGRAVSQFPTVWNFSTISRSVHRTFPQYPKFLACSAIPRSVGLF